MAELGGLVLGYAAGALSTLSPRVLPLLPIILFGVLEQRAWGPLALAAGLSASFAGVGIFLVSLDYSLGIDPTAFRLGAAALILIIASFSWFQRFRTGLLAIAHHHMADRAAH